MIYEVRTYSIAVGGLKPALEIWAEAYEHRKKYSELTAAFVTEIGPLNQFIHIWAYDSPDERMRIRKAAEADAHWPPATAKFLLGMRSEIFTPCAGSPLLEPGSLGPVYEYRSYQIKPGTMAANEAAWNDDIAARTKLSPLAVVMNTENGELSKKVHIWPYASMEERARVRVKAVETGVWPPKTGGTVLTQRNKILTPVPFSPMQ